MVRTRELQLGGDLRYLLTALCLLALVATFAVPVLAPGLAAYAPAHGHLTLDGHVPANHVHPWDAEAGVDATDAADSSTATSDLAFTLADDGEAASGWASATLVPEPIAVAGAAFVFEGVADDSAAPDAPASVAPSPPPRI